MKPLLLILILFCIKTYSQHQFEVVSRDEVRKLTNDASLSTYYPKLLKRFNVFDTTLSNRDYQLLYYGFEFQNGYNGTSDHGKGEILSLINDKKYAAAIKLCDSVLQIIPISLTANYLEGLALNDMDASESKVLKYRNRYRRLRDAILHSGNGFKCETGLMIIYMVDAEDLMFRYFEIAGNPARKTESPVCVSYSINPTKYFNDAKIYFVQF